MSLLAAIEAIKAIQEKIDEALKRLKKAEEATP